MVIKECFYIFLFCIILSASGFCQAPVKIFAPEIYSTAEYAALKERAGKNKKIPPDFENQILVALSYFPELVNTRIEFRFKHTNTSFSTQPSITSVLQRRGRR